MTRIRTIKPEFWHDEKMAPMAAIDRLVFLGLISMSDDYGRVHDNVKVIDAFIFPETDETVRESLANLSRIGRIARGMSSGGMKILQIVNWDKHQRVDKPQPNKSLPPIDKESGIPHENIKKHEGNDIREQFSNDSGTARESVAPLTSDLRSPISDPLPPISDHRPSVHLAKQVLPVSVQEFFDRWNKFAAKHQKLKPCRKLTTERDRKIRTRLKDEKWFPDFLEAVASLPLGGEGWQPTLDWLIENEVNAYRLLEGQFDWRSKDDPAALKLAKLRRQEAYEKREEFERCKKEQIKSNVNGLHKVIESTLPAMVGRDENGFGSSTLFGTDDTLFANGAELSNHCSADEKN